MASIDISADSVTVTLSAAEKLEALHGDVTVPRSAITTVRAVPDGMAELRGLRMPGTGIPGMLMVGTLRAKDFVMFAVCHARRPAVVIDLTEAAYDRIVVTTDEAESIAASLTG